MPVAVYGSRCFAILWQVFRPSLAMAADGVAAPAVAGVPPDNLLNPFNCPIRRQGLENIRRHNAVLRRQRREAEQRRRMQVMRGSKQSTKGGLRRGDLVINRRHRAVSKRKSDVASAAFNGSVFQKWNECCKRGRLALGFLPGFVPRGGQTEDGKKLLEFARATRRIEGW